MVHQQQQVYRWVQRIQAQLATYSDEYLKLCRKRKLRQQQDTPGVGSSSSSSKRDLVVPAAAMDVKEWFKQPSAEQCQQGEAAAAGGLKDPAADLMMEGALSQMKYYLLDGPLAARVCLASSDAQARGDASVVVCGGSLHECCCRLCYIICMEVHRCYCLHVLLVFDRCQLQLC